MQEEIRALIIEDEEIWSHLLVTGLDELGYTVAGIADTFEKAISLLSTAEFDIVLLDICLNERNSGIEIGKLINTMYHKPFIFITASFDKNTISEAILAYPSAYLPKPVNMGSLVVAIQNAIGNYQDKVVPAAKSTNDDLTYFFVKQGNKYKKINWTDVVYLRAGKNYTCLFNASDKTEYFIRSTFPKTLQYIVPQGKRAQFLQINRAEAIQVVYINELAGDEVITDFKTFAISDAFIKSVKQQLRLLS